MNKLINLIAIMIKLWHKKVNYILQFTLKKNLSNKSSKNLTQTLKCATKSLFGTSFLIIYAWINF